MTGKTSIYNEEWFRQCISSILEAVSLGKCDSYCQFIQQSIGQATNRQLSKFFFMLINMESELAARRIEPKEEITRILYQGQLTANQEILKRFKELGVLKKRSTKETKLLTDITNSIISSLDMKEIFRIVATKVSKLVHFDRASIVLIDEKNNKTYAFVLVTRSESSYLEGEYPLQGTAQEWIIQNRRSCIEDNLGNSRFLENKPLFLEGLRSSIRVPLLFRGKIIGSINMDSKEYGSYKKAERKLLEQVAGQIAIAVENSRLFEEVKQRANEIATINTYLENTVHQKTIKIMELEKKRAIMTGLIAHSLKNPIIGLRQAIKLILNQEMYHSPSFLRRFLDELYSSCNMLLGIVNDMLDVYRYEFDKVPLSLEHVRITEPLYDALHLLRYEISDKNVHVNIAAESKDYTVNGDRKRLGRVFLNLLDNAVKFSSPGGRIDVSIFRENDESGCVVVTIEDEGPGIPEPDLGRIFDQFYQVERKNIPIKDGSGLGLYYCKMLAEAHGGKILAENRPSGGTCMKLSLCPADKESEGVERDGH